MIPKLNLLGLGINGIKHLSQETIEVISMCNVIYLIPQTINKKEIIDYLKMINPNVIDISYLYRHDEQDVDIYTKMSQIIWDGMKDYEKVGFIVPGNPVICVNVTQILINNCKRKEIPYKIYPAISSIDTILAELAVDIGKRGISIYLADRIILENKTIDTKTDLLVFQIGALGTARMKLKRECEYERYSEFHKYLLSFYEEDQSCYLIETENGISESTKIIEKKLIDLFSNTEEMDNLTTLYIPAISCEINQEYLSKLKKLISH